MWYMFHKLIQTECARVARSTLSLLMLLAATLDRLYDEDGDDMMMIGYEIRESPEQELPTLFERTSEVF